MNIIDQHVGERFAIYQGDCVQALQGIPDNSIDYAIFSPPFEALYSYSDYIEDMGNSRTSEEFDEHYRFLVSELIRVLKPGRLVSVHCMLLTSMKVMHGYIGLRDFRGDIIRMHQVGGFIFHSEVTIWKSPVVEMQRTKSLGLLYKQLCKDSAMSRQGLADYLCTFRKPGTNPDPVTHTRGNFPLELWQRVAEPVWYDIDQTRVLNGSVAREQQDERHICPLQLDVIERGVELWTNPGDVILSPFAGIGSEGYVALKTGRRFVGVELKESYYRQAVTNLQVAEREREQPTLLDLIEQAEAVV